MSLHCLTTVKIGNISKSISDAASYSRFRKFPEYLGCIISYIIKGTAPPNVLTPGFSSNISSWSHYTGLEANSNFVQYSQSSSNSKFHNIDSALSMTAESKKNVALGNPGF
jgi:hypothetical protein